MTEVYELSASPPKFTTSDDGNNTSEPEVTQQHDSVPTENITFDISPPQETSELHAAEASEAAEDEINTELCEGYDRAKLLAQLEAYNELFGHTHLKNMDLRNLSRKSSEELNELYRSCKFQLNTRQGFKSAHTMYLAGMSILEVTGKKTGLKLDGLTQIASNNSELHSLIDELAVQYIDKFNMPPEQRLVFATMQMVAQIHLINSASLAATSSQAKASSFSTTPEAPKPVPNADKCAKVDTIKDEEKRDEIIKDL